MPKTIQIRDVDDDVYRELQRRAVDQGVTVPELLRAEMRRWAARPPMADWLQRMDGRSSSTTTAQILADLDAVRGEADDRR